MPTGKIVFLLRTAKDALPINSGSITVRNDAGETVFYEFLTAVSSGISKVATLETPPKMLSLDSGDVAQPYSVYNVSIRAEGSYRMLIEGVQLFEGVVSQLPIELIPLPEGTSSPEDVEIIVIRIPEHILRSRLPNATQSSEVSQEVFFETAIPAVNITEGVFIPETVVVHLGAPDENAANVSVGFSDYIKNVASSEIYPTWPRASLEANIIAQISLTLNRIYTEWYRSRGYQFDITSSTAYDQAFVYGRNIYEEVSIVVDEIFNRYLSRPNRVEPLFASYCDGTTTTCAGLSQWGTVALAEGGQSSDEILGFYYGEIVINETDDIRAPTESYPNTPLQSGSTGEDVRVIQEQLNRIAINFPQLPLIEVSSVYDDSTVASVREFQRLFVLPVTGITDRATWYRISQIYSSVKRLSELTSEGQRAIYNQQLYPGYPLMQSSRGSEVQEIQFYLQRIARFNPIVESPELDGIYGSDTARAVRSFQSAYGLTANGIVDEAVWNRIVEIYNGTLDNVDEPSGDIPVIPYPETVLSAGSRGEYVRYIQQLLNRINNVFLTINELDEDGIFGAETERAVNSFAVLFGYTQDGTINEALWNKINEIYLTVAAECIFATGESEGARGFPGTVLSIGSSGESVVYIQNRINTIYGAIPYVGELIPDGRYGGLTANSVAALQRVFGLSESGETDESTWLLINYVSAAVLNGCLPTAGARDAMRVFNEKASAVLEEKGVSVSCLKELMKKNGISVGVGPLFGLKSRSALARWQALNGLEPTGLPDLETRKKLATALKNENLC